MIKNSTLRCYFFGFNFFIVGINNLKNIIYSTFGRYGTMANKNFVVHNGLTVGTLTVDAATGHLTTTGNLSVSGSILQDGAEGATLDDAAALAVALG
jgi:hypothetical protein